MELRVILSEDKESEKLIIDFIKRKTVDGGSQGVKQLLYMLATGEYIYNNGLNIMPLQVMQPQQASQQYNNTITCETQESKETREEDLKIFESLMNEIELF